MVALDASAANSGTLNAGTPGALMVAPATWPLAGTVPTRIVTVAPAGMVPEGVVMGAVRTMVIGWAGVATRGCSAAAVITTGWSAGAVVTTTDWSVSAGAVVSTTAWSVSVVAVATTTGWPV